ncbi:mannitol-1-phosphate 5-dehydrogenase [Gemella sp. zg-570]|uniref:mannitol-1-phosphate 5-dehydrogenase n=1 Tax=Gemella sp. zg-570 TaxID=2840371 RepID=UPI001C0C03DC|nr:mannitol-1-phosphate 5-dehydrogenase [Gemella sp. zg-570]QWQ38529.1 mannitol-1-phosphate 5-dehydrogenase [Gemella sp. zg-570]
MKNLHFGAGNIGRGFIGELLNKSGYHVTFVDINEEVVENLKNRDTYKIKVLDNKVEEVIIDNFYGLNIATEKEKLVEYVGNVELITTSIGPNVLPIIAKDIAAGLSKKYKDNNTKFLDIVACENMIEGSNFLKNEIFKNLSSEEISFVEKYVGFPNSAVDRIVPAQKHDDVLLVEVEKFCEWVVEVDKIKVQANKNIQGVNYVKDLNPFIERKLFTVNTGHAALSYIASYKGINLVSDAAQAEEVRESFIKVLEETSALLVAKWNFDTEDMDKYRKKTIKRFENKLIVDNVARICRTPIRKLGENERFIKPIKECIERNLEFENLAKTCAYILKFKAEDDEQALKLQNLLAKKSVKETIKEITNFDNEQFLNIIETTYKNL